MLDVARGSRTRLTSTSCSTTCRCRTRTHHPGAAPAVIATGARNFRRGFIVRVLTTALRRSFLPRQHGQSLSQRGFVDARGFSIRRTRRTTRRTRLAICGPRRSLRQAEALDPVCRRPGRAREHGRSGGRVLARGFQGSHSSKAGVVDPPAGRDDRPRPSYTRRRQLFIRWARPTSSRRPIVLRRVIS